MGLNLLKATSVVLITCCVLWHA